MKKTLAAIAVLGTFAGSVPAADVQVYGVVDTGFAYTRTDLDDNQGTKDSFALSSGLEAGSRFGFKGVETLSDNVKVGFILESGINIDNGSNALTGTLFNRESSLFVQGDFGKLGLGRIGSFNQALGSWALLPRLSAFGPSFSTYAAQIGNVFSNASCISNMVAYGTPDFGGLKLYAMYNMGTDGAENKSSTDRYYGLAATYDQASLSVYGAVDSTNYRSDLSDSVDDGFTITAGGSYKFNSAKVYLGTQYFYEVKGTSLGGILKTDKTRSQYMLKGYSLTLSGEVPVLAGKGRIGMGYVDAERTDADADLTRYVATIAYDYDFSKRSNAYAAVSYMNDKIEGGSSDWNPSAYSVLVGLRHRF